MLRKGLRKTAVRVNLTISQNFQKVQKYNKLSDEKQNQMQTFHFTTHMVELDCFSYLQKVKYRSLLFTVKLEIDINACKEHLEQMKCIAVHYCLNETDLY